MVETVLERRRARPPAPRPSPTPEPTGWRVDLLARLPWLGRLVKLRSFQFLAILPNLALFYFMIIAGLFGSPVGNRNIIIVFVWILWWFLLIAVMVPFGSRVWCTMCPLPFFGDWLQRRALVRVRPGRTAGFKNQFFGLNKRWPKALSNIWLQNFGFLSLCTFSVALVTRPIVSVGVLGSLFVLAAVLALIYRLRSFCNYVCPVSGFLSLYSMASMVELRSPDLEVCKQCRSKACVAGSEQGWACPWGIYVGRLERNNYCGLCMECVKACPNDNVSVYARPFCSDIKIKGYDEAWKAFIMLGLALVYSVTLLGPWGWLKDWANISEVGNWSGWGIYAGSVWFLTLVGLPALFYLAVRAGKWLAGRHQVPTRDLFLGYVYTLVPLGLLAWIAFSVPLLMVNGSYIVSVISDPAGMGWDLFGTARFPWTPVLPEYTPLFQIPLLLLGLWFALVRGHHIGVNLLGDRRAALLSLAPVALLLSGIVGVFLRLFVG